MSGGRGLAQRGATVRDTALLLALMVHQATECGRLVLYSGKHLDITDRLPGRQLLTNVEWVKADTDVNKKIGAFMPRWVGGWVHNDFDMFEICGTVIVKHGDALVKSRRGP